MIVISGERASSGKDDRDPANWRHLKNPRKARVSRVITQQSTTRRTTVIARDHADNHKLITSRDHFRASHVITSELSR